MFWWIVRVLSVIAAPRWLTRIWVARARGRAGDPTPYTMPRRVFVDVTGIARHDRATGIQRVVRAVTRELRDAPRGWVVQAVRWQHGSFRCSNWPQPDEALVPVMELRRGDVFLGLDLSFDAVRRNARAFLSHRRAGAIIWFVVYDILPIRTPRFFSSKVVVRFRWWIIATAKIADGYACISETTAEEMRVLFRSRLRCADRPKIAVIPMGFDSLPLRPLESKGDCDRATRSVLAVGTIEPRKAYGDVLSAFDLLWDRGIDISLTIVGAPGWKTTALQRRILNHRMYGRSLFWDLEMTDSDLAALYDRVDLLVAASYGEGFGLPVVEAIAHGCPVLARDIPVFREHAHRGLRYFPRHSDARQLADAVAIAIEADHRHARVNAEGLAQWCDTANALWGLIDQDARPTNAS